MFRQTGLKQKAKLKKPLESFAVPPGHVDREPCRHTLIFNVCGVWENWYPGGTFLLQRKDTAEGIRQPCSTVDFKLKLKSYKVLLKDSWCLFLSALTQSCYVWLCACSLDTWLKNQVTKDVGGMCFIAGLVFRQICVWGRDVTIYFYKMSCTEI